MPPIARSRRNRALCTIGDHIRRRRLDLGLLQRHAAAAIGADTASVNNWELARTKPALRFLPGVIRFLGYVPWTADGSIGERLLAYRQERGLSQSALARLPGVDPGTLGRWERGLRVPAGQYARRAAAFVESFHLRSLVGTNPLHGHELGVSVPQAVQGS